MIRSLNDLNGYTVSAVDGEIGPIDAFYFDEFSWQVRYLVINTADWLDVRHVLFSPLALDKADDENQRVEIMVKQDTIRESPAIDIDRPITRENEIELHTHFNWPFYWVPIDHTSVPLVEMLSEMREKTGANEVDQEDPRLHSTRHVTGYNIEARDGRIGHVQDFVVDDESWKILYLVVDTGAWLPGRRVLLSPQWIEEINWSEGSVTVDLNRNTIQNSPEYNPDEPFNRDYEEQLYRHYDRKGYWGSKSEE